MTDSVCLDVRGADAEPFLHAQLSRAIEGFAPSEAPLAGWHDARGRTRALVRVCRFPDRWLLVTPHDGALPLVKKLRLFVLRAAVTIEVASDVTVAAVLSATPGWLSAQGLPAATPPNGVVTRDALRFVRIGDDYWQVLGAAAELEPLAAALVATDGDAVALAEIRLGVPTITAGLAERFVAQMLNLDALGAVSFDKGCYPGQEIIARVHHLGGVKRRVHRFGAATTPPAVGTAVTAGGAEVGEVVRSAAAESGCELLAVVDHAALAGPLACGGAALRPLALPFAVPTD